MYKRYNLVLNKRVQAFQIGTELSGTAKENSVLGCVCYMASDSWLQQRAQRRDQEGGMSAQLLQFGIEETNCYNLAKTYVGRASEATIGELLGRGGRGAGRALCCSNSSRSSRSSSSMQVE